MTTINTTNTLFTTTTTATPANPTPTAQKIAPLFTPNELAFNYDQTLERAMGGSLSEFYNLVEYINSRAKAKKSTADAQIKQYVEREALRTQGQRATTSRFAARAKKVADVWAQLQSYAERIIKGMEKTQEIDPDDIELLMSHTVLKQPCFERFTTKDLVDILTGQWYNGVSHHGIARLQFHNYATLEEVADGLLLVVNQQSPAQGNTQIEILLTGEQAFNLISTMHKEDGTLQNVAYSQNAIMDPGTSLETNRDITITYDGVTMVLEAGSVTSQETGQVYTYPEMRLSMTYQFYKCVMFPAMEARNLRPNEENLYPEYHLHGELNKSVYGDARHVPTNAAEIDHMWSLMVFYLGKGTAGITTRKSKNEQQMMLNVYKYFGMRGFTDEAQIRDLKIHTQLMNAYKLEQARRAETFRQGNNTPAAAPLPTTKVSKPKIKMIDDTQGNTQQEHVF